MAQIRHGQIAQASRDRAKIHAGMEEELDDADAGQRSQCKMLYTARHREETFEARGDIALHLLRRHARIERRHDDRRDMQRREDVHGHSCERVEAKDRYYQGSHDYYVGIPQ